MPQPTSCGPGPPNNFFEINNNKFEIRQTSNGRSGKGKRENQKQHSQYRGSKVEKVNNDYDDYVDNKKAHAHEQQQIKIKEIYTKNKCDIYNNYHFSNFKLYLKKVTTQITTAIKTTYGKKYNKKYAFQRAASNLCSYGHLFSNLALLAAKTFVNASTIIFPIFSSSTGTYFSYNAIARSLPVTAVTTATPTNSEKKFCHFYCNFTRTNTTTSKWILMFLMLFNILTQTSHQVAAEKSKHYYMQSLCKNHFLQQLYRKIDGAVLWSQNERNLDCIITFQTHSILQRFMLRFDMLQLDCNDHLYVYDGAHAVTTPKINISCRQTRQTVGSILTRTNFVTLKYVTDNWGTDANGFKLVITSVKDPKHTCKDFTCGSNGFCIHPDLLCDGINHCSDNSDESVNNLCQNETASTLLGLDMTWFVMIVVSILLILSAAIVGITICVYRRQEETNNQENAAIQLHHNSADTNGSSKHLHFTHGDTLTKKNTQLPPTSGNWHHPAGPYTGYHNNYLKMATIVRPIICLANFVKI